MEQRQRQLSPTNKTTRSQTIQSPSRHNHPSSPINNDDKQTVKRLKSLDTKTQKKTPLPSKRKTKDLAIKLNYKLSSDVISLELDEQRNNQMKIINSDEQLQRYFIAFKKMFLVFFQASHFLMENMFQLTQELYSHKQLKIVCLMYEVHRNKWDVPFLNRALVLARNVIFMASSAHQFQRRIDMVARKVTVQQDKRNKIKTAFLNHKIQKTWQKAVQQHFQDEDTQTFVQDQFDTVQQKMCFLQIKQFVLTKLSTQKFGNQLKKYGFLEQIDQDVNLDFKFEFLLTEQFSFNTPDFMKKDSPQKPSQFPTQKPSEQPCILM